MRQRRRFGGRVLSCVSGSILLDRDAFAVVDAGSQLGPWSSKCLQTSILYLCSDAKLQAALHSKLLQSCSNNAGSGFLCPSVQRRNLHSVHRALSQVRKCVHIVAVSSSSAQPPVDGSLLWELGCPGGESLGVLLWFVDASHVLVCQRLRVHNATRRPEKKWPCLKAVVCGPKGSPVWMSGVSPRMLFDNRFGSGRC